MAFTDPLNNRVGSSLSHPVPHGPTPSLRRGCTGVGGMGSKYTLVAVNSRKLHPTSRASLTRKPLHPVKHLNTLRTLSLSQSPTRPSLGNVDGDPSKRPSPQILCIRDGSSQPSLTQTFNSCNRCVGWIQRSSTYNRSSSMTSYLI